MMRPALEARDWAAFCADFQPGDLLDEVEARRVRAAELDGLVSKTRHGAYILGKAVVVKTAGQPRRVRHIVPGSPADKLLTAIFGQERKK
jgi:hypothetical protein